MLTTEQAHKTIAYEAFTNMEHAIQVAMLQGEVQQEKARSQEAMQLIEQQQATIMKQQASIEEKQAAADTLAHQLSDIGEFNEMTVAQMLSDVQRWRDDKAAKTPVLTDVVDSEGGHA